MKITICGGGSLGHVIAGYIANQAKHEVRVLTRRPNQWSKKLNISLPEGTIIEGVLDNITNDAQAVIPDSDLILLCVPGFGIRDVLAEIAPYLTQETFVGSVVSSTGFFFEAENILGNANCPLFGFQRVPFIARVNKYGQSAHLLGYKPSLNLAVEHATPQQQSFLQDIMSSLFGVQVTLLKSHYEASLTNSNPLLHPSRIYTMWRDWHDGVTYNSCPMFYADWTDDASRLYIEMDNEFQVLLTKLPVPDIHIQDVLSYYESHDASSLTRKLRSITAFKTIASPMRQIDSEHFIPDFKSRYFTEDFPYGMYYIVKVAHDCNSAIPTIEKVFTWGMSMVKR